MNATDKFVTIVCIIALSMCAGAAVNIAGSQPPFRIAQLADGNGDLQWRIEELTWCGAYKPYDVYAPLDGSVWASRVATNTFDNKKTAETYFDKLVTERRKLKKTVIGVAKTSDEVKK